MAALPTVRHSLVVRATHWMAAACILALLVSGGEILLSHPRFYWGETGNVLTEPLFKLPFPASRNMVPTGYDYVLPDQNGWSRALHFQTAWIVVLTGLVYLLAGRHFRRELLPRAGDFSWHAFSQTIAGHLRRRQEGAATYNALQRIAYSSVVFVLFPLVVWTGVAMSPAFVAAFPISVGMLGGQQSARTLHFFVSIALLAFLFVHIAMVALTGFRTRMRAMISGRALLKEKA